MPEMAAPDAAELFGHLQGRNDSGGQEAWAPFRWGGRLGVEEA